MEAAVEVTELSTNFRFDESVNFFESKLKVVYEWKVVDSNTKESIKSGFDGFAYKFSRRQKHWNLDITFYNMIHDNDDRICVSANGSVWSRNSDTPCQLPCKDTFPPTCNDSAVCTMLTMGYKTVPSNTTKLEFPVDFGRIYDVHVIPYSNWKIGHGKVANGLGVVKFCKDELIHRQNVTHDQAHVYCNKVAMFNGKKIDRNVYSGPVSHFEKYDVTMDFRKNRAKVSFRWKKPYDYHPNVTLQKYLIVFDEVTPMAQNLSKSDYDVITIENVTIGKTRSLHVIPVLYLDEDNMTIIVHGADISETFKVEDFDACSEGNAVGGRYCDVVSNCTDLPAPANVSAFCACPEGFGGNGISNKWPEGNGCTDQSSRTSSVVVGVSCAIVLFVIIVFIAICIKSRRSVRRKVLREEEAY